MVDITRTARSIGRDQPAVQATFRLPRDASDKALLAAARGFVESASPLVAVFVAHEMPPKFIEELNAAIANFEDAIKAYAEKKSIHVTATVSIESTMEKAMDALYRLDGIVPNKIKKDQALLREWDAARRVASARSPRTSDSPPARQTEQPSAATAA